MQNNIQEFQDKFIENLQIELENYPQSELIKNKWRYGKGIKK